MLRQGLRPWTVVLTALVAMLASWAVGRWWLDGGNQPVRVTWLAGALLVGMAVAVLVMGRRMWRHRYRGAHVEPLVAARVLGLAQASALTGALTAGGYLGQALLHVPDLDFANRGEIALWHAVAGAGGALVAAAGLVVQSWCRIVDDESGERDELRD